MDDLIRDFLTESVERLDAIRAQLVRLQHDPSDARTIASIFRLVRAIRNACNLLSPPNPENTLASMEAAVDQLLDGPRPADFAFASVQKAIDEIKSALPAMVAGDGRLATIANTLKSAVAVDGGPPDPSGSVGAERADSASAGKLARERRFDGADASRADIVRMGLLLSELALARDQLLETGHSPAFESMSAPMQRFDSLSAELETAMFSARMLPLERLFADLQGLVRELSSKSATKAEVSLRGGGVALDRHSVEAIRGPLSQLIRNAVAHAIEPPAERRGHGKPSVGRIKLSARRISGFVLIEMRDDGRGLSAELVRKYTCASGQRAAVDPATMSVADLLDLTSSPDLPAEEDQGPEFQLYAGLIRLREAIEQVGGSVSVSSRPGRSTAYTLKIPLNEPVQSALIFRSGLERLALPQHEIHEIIEIESEDRHRLVETGGMLSLRVEQGSIPVFLLAEIICGSQMDRSSQADRRLLLRIRRGVQDFAIVIDEILEVQEIVIKPMPAPLRKLDLFSGAALLGDGSIVLALDAGGLAAAFGLPRSEALRPYAHAQFDEGRDAARWIVFRSGGSQLRALPVAVVKSVERLGPGRIQQADNGYFADVCGELLPMFWLGPEAPFDTHERSVSTFILEDANNRSALVVDEVIDIVKQPSNLEPTEANPGVFAVTEMRGQPIEMLDPNFFLHPNRNRRRRLGSEVAPPCVLLIEPDRFFRDMIADALASHGYGTRTVADLAGGLEAVRTQPAVGHILVDLDTIAASQGDFIRLIEGDSIDEAPVVIGLAAHDGSLARSKARRAGLASAIGKFDRAAILAAVNFERESEPLAEIAA